MDLHNLNTKKHFAWFDKHIATDTRGETKERQAKAITPEDEGYPIVKHKSDNLIHSEVSMLDVLLDRDCITWDEYTNGF